MRLRKKLSSSREKTKKHDISEFINLTDNKTKKQNHRMN